MSPSNWIRTTALCALPWALISCATPSIPGKIEAPKPVAVDPRVCAAIEKEPPVLGSIVQPATEDERQATGEFLSGEAEARSWGRRGWERAGMAKKTVCP